MSVALRAFFIVLFTVISSLYSWFFTDTLLYIIFSFSAVSIFSINMLFEVKYSLEEVHKKQTVELEQRHAMEIVLTQEQTRKQAQQDYENRIKELVELKSALDFEIRKTVKERKQLMQDSQRLKQENQTIKQEAEQIKMEAELTAKHAHNTANAARRRMDKLHH